MSWPKPSERTAELIRRCVNRILEDSEGILEAVNEASIPDEVAGVGSDPVLLRNYRRFGWIVLYLFGVSPTVCKSFLRARNANEVLRAQTAKLRLQKLAGDLVDRTKATGLVFELARRERDSWMNWPPRVAANMAAELGVDAHKMELVLDKFIRSHLADLSEIKLELR